MTASHLPNIQRGGACSNCRRRKLRCDGDRPSCSQCLNRPPRSKQPCQFEQERAHGHQTPSQMQGTIKTLLSKVHDLERSRVSPTPEPDEAQILDFQEPTPEIAAELITAFLEKFAHSGHFFLDLTRFAQSALLPLPFGHPSRPSPALLSVIYLWGSLLSTSIPHHSNDSTKTFLCVTLQNLPADIRGFAIHPKLVLETIQAEILLSIYYLHSALPTQGRYHAATAASLAISAGLHILRRVPIPNHCLSNPQFPVSESLLPPTEDPIEAVERIDAFWATVIVNNCWVAVQGSPSAIPGDMTVDTPWPGGILVGATLSRFLKGQETDGETSTSLALFSKASVLLERVCSLNAGRMLDDSVVRSALDNRLSAFQSSLTPPTPIASDRALVFAHAFSDLAILRFHSPHLRNSEHSRYQALAAATRMVSVVSLATWGDPLYAPICSAACAVFLDELASLRSTHANPSVLPEYQQTEQNLKWTMNTMRNFATSSPIFQRCVAAMQ
ncbi:hypothetical protein MIND_00813700 [Mycena indigotica]|uniref:Zn(2)-C6 fungal-type domain-containing protein n=1 Tax=Mycena indigotica TaxID=2126181 RepID=A0A8H6SH19_9AGAR|nr:uncharacterized protein MIND_00813700 [Mycena indigotica]KAF7298665.1 hypothetical protein MIND_00813700 [Mycena indigotica]